MKANDSRVRHNVRISRNSRAVANTGPDSDSPKGASSTAIKAVANTATVLASTAADNPVAANPEAASTVAELIVAVQPEGDIVRRRDVPIVPRKAVVQGTTKAGPKVAEPVVIVVEVRTVHD